MGAVRSPQKVRQSTTFILQHLKLVPIAVDATEGSQGSRGAILHMHTRCRPPYSHLWPMKNLGRKMMTTGLDRDPYAGLRGERLVHGDFFWPSLASISYIFSLRTCLPILLLPQNVIILNSHERDRKARRPLQTRRPVFPRRMLPRETRP